MTFLPRGVRKSVFAARIGVSPSRVSQLIAEGMPVELDDTIDEISALAWCRANVRVPWRMRIPEAAPDLSGLTEDAIDQQARTVIEGAQRVTNGSDLGPLDFASG